MSNWTKIYKIKTGFFDSVILNKIKKGEEYLNKLYEWRGYKKNYIKQQEMVQIVIFFIINVIIKVQQYVYVKMIKEVFLEDIYLLLGQQK